MDPGLTVLDAVVYGPGTGGKLGRGFTVHLFSTWGFSTLTWMWAAVPPDALQMGVSGRGAHMLKGEKESCEKECKPLGLCKHRFKS